MTKVCGIYRIWFDGFGPFYIGSSMNIVARIGAHRSSLRRGDHHCAAMQSAWNSLGENSFQFETLEFCKEEELVEREQFYIDISKLDGLLLLNEAPFAGNCSGIKQSEETKLKRAMKLLGTKRSKEQCQRISASKKGKSSEAIRKAVAAAAEKRRFLLSHAEASAIADRNKRGETLKQICRSLNVSHHPLYREMRRHMPNFNFIHRGSRGVRVHPVGAAHHMARLTDKAVIEIRSRKNRIKYYAAKFKVSLACVYDVIYRRSWTHL